MIKRNRTTRLPAKPAKASRKKVVPSQHRNRKTRSSRPAPPAGETVKAPAVTPSAEPPAAIGDVIEVTTTTIPEPALAARVLPPEPDRVHRVPRRAIFFDVENSSRADHIEAVIDHLVIDHVGRATELFAVGNWRVIGQDTARLLARNGAHLVHSAPSVGVRDWSDLRIAVSAGVWLAGAKAGDGIEIVTDDQAFDAVGDVAANLGIAYRRLSYRALVGLSTDDTEAEAATVESSSHRRRRRGPRRRRPDDRQRGSRGPTERPSPRPAPVPAPAPAPAPEETPVEAHTAPHDEILAIVRTLLSTSADRGVSLDALANALRGAGFRRTSGSPRLITRLRRIKELAVDRNGLITLADTAVRPGTRPPDDELAPRLDPVVVASRPAGPAAESAAEVEAPGALELEPSPDRLAPSSDEADAVAAESGVAEDPSGPRRPHRWRRYRRGGRRWRRPGGEATVAQAPTPAS